MNVRPPLGLKSPLRIPHKLLMGPGPSNSSPRILNALSQPILGHMHSELFDIMDEIKKGIQYVFQTNNQLTLAISASGHAGMEAVLCNLLEPHDVVLILINGIWGERAANLAERYGAIVRKLVKTALGSNFSIIEIENAVKIHQPKLLFVVQGESSTGIYQPIIGIGEITRRYNCLLVVDTVASLGAVPFLMDKWKVDAAYSGSQKIIGAPPGLAPISFNERALKTIANRKTPIPVYFWDITLLGQQWNCFERSAPRLYHHTTSATLLYGLREGLAVIADEGLEQVIKRHQHCAAQLYEGIEALGMQLYVDEEHKRLPSVTTIKVPDGVDWRKVTEYAMKRYKLEISGGLGPTAGKVFRVGIMGYNATQENIVFVLDVLKEALKHSVTSSKL
ncbi:alanine--glyoxylate aminotransferase isoform X2 [Dendroctonus ponderosae]